MATAPLKKNILERVTEYVETSLFANKAENSSEACQTSDGYLKVGQKLVFGTGFSRTSNFNPSLSSRLSTLALAGVGLLATAAISLALKRNPLGIVLSNATFVGRAAPVLASVTGFSLLLTQPGCEPSYSFPVEDTTHCDGKAFTQSFVDSDPGYLSAVEKTEREKVIQTVEAGIRGEIGASRWQFCHYNGVLYTSLPNPDNPTAQNSYDPNDKKIRLLKWIFSTGSSSAASENFCHELTHRFSGAWTAVDRNHQALSQGSSWQEKLDCPDDILSSPKKCLFTTDQLQKYPNVSSIQKEERLAYSAQKILLFPLWGALIYYQVPEVVKFIAGNIYGSAMLREIEAIQNRRGRVSEVETSFQVDQQLEVPSLKNGDPSSSRQSVFLPIGQGAVAFLTHEKSISADEEWVTLFVPAAENSVDWKKFTLRTPIKVLAEEVPYGFDFHQNRFAFWAQNKLHLYSTENVNPQNSALYLGSYTTQNEYRKPMSDTPKQAVAVLNPTNFMLLQQDDEKNLKYELIDTSKVSPKTFTFDYPPEFKRDLEKATFVKAIDLPNGKIGWWLGGIEDQPLRKKGVLYEMIFPSPFDLEKYSSNPQGPIGFKKIKEVYLPSDKIFPRLYKKELYLVSSVNDGTYSTNYLGSPNIAMIRLDDFFTPIEWNYRLAPAFLPKQNKNISAHDLRNRLLIDRRDFYQKEYFFTATENGFIFYSPQAFPIPGQSSDDRSLDSIPLFLKFTPR